MSILATFDQDEDVTDFVRCKIESLVANSTTADPLSTPGKQGREEYSQGEGGTGRTDWNSIQAQDRENSESFERMYVYSHPLFFAELVFTVLYFCGLSWQKKFAWNHKEASA